MRGHILRRNRKPFIIMDHRDDGSHAINNSKSSHQQDNNDNVRTDQRPAQRQSEDHDVMGIVWKNVILFVILHSSLLYSLYALIFEWPWRTLFSVSTLLRDSCHLISLIIATALGIGSGIGVTVGAHRLWSHRAYKARLPLRLFLAMMQTVAGQVSVESHCSL